MNKMKDRKTVSTLVAILATFVVGGLAASRDATPNVSGASLVLQVEQTQPGSEVAAPLDTSFTYQGRLKDGPNPANGQYDFEFKLFDSLTGGTQVGTTLSRSNLTVSDGLVTTSLVFGIAFQGQERYLEVAVRPTGGASFATLSPRHEVAPAPYAMGIRAGTIITSTFSTVTIGGNSAGVSGLSTSFGANGLLGVNDLANSSGVRGVSENGRAISGFSADGFAGYFEGDVRILEDLTVVGNLSKGGGSFKIDHPLDPANKYLYHSFVESPDMMNIYNGNVTTGDAGEAVVTLPPYFDALNRDFRYQLTVMGQFANAIVLSKIKDNRFTIKTDKPNVEVSWQVTGIRKDPYAEQNRIPVEVDKSKEEQGKYLHPGVYGQPEEQGIGYELMLPNIEQTRP